MNFSLTSLLRGVPVLLAPLLVGVALGAGGLASCTPEVVAVQPAKRCELQLVTLDVIASKLINPTPAGEPRPVQLRIYQLASDIRLQNASFEEIWKQDADTLKDDLIKVDELSVYPDSRTEVRFERDPAAQAVVGVALFQNPKGRSWYQTFELPPAPGKGMCGMPSPSASAAPCDGPDCKDGPKLDPHFSIWIDGTRVDNGDEHLDDPPPGRTQVVTLKAKAAAPASSAPASVKK
jgi:type VI secretion system protein VasD